MEVGQKLIFTFFGILLLPDAGQREQALAKANVLVDSRSDFLRIGFAVYQDQPMVGELLARMRSLP